MTVQEPVFVHEEATDHLVEAQAEVREEFAAAMALLRGINRPLKYDQDINVGPGPGIAASLGPVEDHTHELLSVHTMKALAQLEENGLYLRGH